MQIHETSLTGGFTNPVLDSQNVFRTVMNCMAQPGTIGEVAMGVEPPAPLGAAAGAVMLTLCDHDTAVWLGPHLLTPGITGWLGFHCGAPLTKEKTEAKFAFAHHKAPLPSLMSFAQGTLEYPDRSTTLVIEVEALDGGPTLELKGPGIRTTALLSPKGLPEHVLKQWAKNGQIFPQGVDVILTAGHRLAALPRTCKISLKEA
ncbi:phosphonate C-P lyase system protein PhnH [Rhizobium oryzicola]|uniref:Phosphonate C-P lyase system protein PhnH n=1 Tax=Rhizobium oryzicola TaxID=1232668 RepID=A0ABT8T0L0_9HYPH|nr:phosphonate C-P lyase system protein PhnH [Rhizobium oryzicola]MDO1584161.1 phosphonate C-P lyase system protein PhnH [Rhizobium oryzicola]